jgi:hypothetical protein
MSVGLFQVLCFGLVLALVLGMSMGTKDLLT